MTKHKVAIAIGVAIAVWLLFFRKAKAAAVAPSVPGDVSSGKAAAHVETNVLNDNFGLVVDAAGDVTDPGDVATGSETP